MKGLKCVYFFFCFLLVLIVTVSSLSSPQSLLHPHHNLHFYSLSITSLFPFSIFYSSFSPSNTFPSQSLIFTPTTNYRVTITRTPTRTHARTPTPQQVLDKWKERVKFVAWMTEAPPPSGPHMERKIGGLEKQTIFFCAFV